MQRSEDGCRGGSTKEEMSFGVVGFAFYFESVKGITVGKIH